MKSRHINNISYKDIKLTFHAQDRALERLGVTRKDELCKLAASAKKNGINLNSLDLYNHEELGITYDELVMLKRKYSPRNNSQKNYLYKNHIWVFFGNDGRTLKTIIPFDCANGRFEVKPNFKN